MMCISLPHSNPNLHMNKLPVHSPLCAFSSKRSTIPLDNLKMRRRSYLRSLRGQRREGIFIVRKLPYSSSSRPFNKPISEPYLLQPLAGKRYLDLFVYKKEISKRGLIRVSYHQSRPTEHLFRRVKYFFRTSTTTDLVNPAIEIRYAKYELSTQVVYEDPKIVEIEVGLLNL